MELESVNPIGKVQVVPEFEEKIIELSNQWDEKIKNSNSWIKNRVSITTITLFLIGALDELIVTINEFLESGPDKKATVLNGLDRLYEYVLREGIPIWLRPFASVVKNYVIYSLASSAIDYFVAKYKNGVWKK
jgi:hypothetical protein